MGRYYCAEEAQKILQNGIFLFSHSLWGAHLSSFLGIRNSFKRLKATMCATSNSTAFSGTVVRGIAYTKALSCTLRTLDGRPSPSTSWQLSSPLRNALTYHCAERSIVVHRPSASMISRAVSAAFVLARAGKVSCGFPVSQCCLKFWRKMELLFLNKITTMRR